MTKLEQFYNAIPERAREHYGIEYLGEGGHEFVRISKGLWTTIREADVDFEKYDFGVDEAEYSLTIYLRNVVIVLRSYELGSYDVQLVLL